MKINFYNHKNENISISISISLEDGVLKLEGYDYGSNVENLRGMSDEFEYSLTLDKENTDKLFKKLDISDKTTQQKLETVKDRFSKDKGVFGLDKFCEENDIKTSYFSWP